MCGNVLFFVVVVKTCLYDKNNKTFVIPEMPFLEFFIIILRSVIIIGTAARRPKNRVFDWSQRRVLLPKNF